MCQNFRKINPAYLGRLYNKDQEFKTLIHKETSFLDKFPDIIRQQRIYHFVNSIKDVPLCYCGKPKKYSTTRKYLNSCGSKECNQKHLESVMLSKYGVKNYANSKEYLEKCKTTCLKNYGVKYPSQSKEVQEKIKKTNRERYGSDWQTQSENFKKKSKITWNEKYGVDNPSLNKDVATKQKKSNIETAIQNILDKYPHLKIKKVAEKNREIEIYCESCKKNYNITSHLLHQRIFSYNHNPCTNCNPVAFNTTSEDEKEIFKFLNSYSKKFKIKVKSIFENNKKELDIYSENLSLGFEFNGLYWHSEIFKDKNYHLEKSKECSEKGIKLIHIWEDQWKYKQKIVKSRILNILEKTPNKIYARKCEIRNVEGTESRNFLNDNHIQGWCPSQIKIGLHFDEELVSLMTFGKRRRSLGKKESKEGEYELIRFCNKINTSVTGGASRLFKYFTNNHNPIEIISYADCSWTTDKENNLYTRLGFEYISATKPNYWYIEDGIRKHRFNFRKDVLVKEGFDLNKSEHEIMQERGIYRIYDCGNFKFTWTKFSQ